MDGFLRDPIIGPLAAMLGVDGFFFSLLFIVVLVWTLIWKALALWHAARNRQKIWFLVFLVLNTIGIVEIIYLKWFKKNHNKGKDETLFNFPAMVSELRELFTSPKK